MVHLKIRLTNLEYLEDGYWVAKTFPKTIQKKSVSPFFTKGNALGKSEALPQIQEVFLSRTIGIQEGIIHVYAIRFEPRRVTEAP